MARRRAPGRSRATRRRVAARWARRERGRSRPPPRSCSAGSRTRTIPTPRCSSGWKGAGALCAGGGVPGRGPRAAPTRGGAGARWLACQRAAAWRSGRCRGGGRAVAEGRAGGAAAGCRRRRGRCRRARACCCCWRAGGRCRSASHPARRGRSVGPPPRRRRARATGRGRRSGSAAAGAAGPPRCRAALPACSRSHGNT